MFLIALTMACAEDPVADGLEPEVDTEEPAEDPADTEDEAEAALDRGERLFGEHCARCHGHDGHGATMLEEVPTEDLLTQIREGNDVYPFMPAFEDELTDRQIEDIADYVETVLWDRS